MRQLSCSLMTVSGEIVLIHVADDADSGGCRGRCATVLASLEQRMVCHGMAPTLAVLGLWFMSVFIGCRSGAPPVFIPCDFGVELDGPIGAILPRNRNVCLCEFIDAQRIIREAEIPDIAVLMMELHRYSYLLSGRLIVLQRGYLIEGRCRCHVDVDVGFYGHWGRWHGDCAAAARDRP